MNLLSQLMSANVREKARQPVRRRGEERYREAMCGEWMTADQVAKAVGQSSDVTYVTLNVYTKRGEMEQRAGKTIGKNGRPMTEWRFK